MPTFPLHCYEKLNQGGRELAQNSGNRAHPSECSHHSRFSCSYGSYSENRSNTIMDSHAANLLLINASISYAVNEKNKVAHLQFVIPSTANVAKTT